VAGLRISAAALLHRPADLVGDGEEIHAAAAERSRALAAEDQLAGEALAEGRVSGRGADPLEVLKRRRIAGVLTLLVTADHVERGGEGRLRLGGEGATVNR